MNKQEEIREGIAKRVCCLNPQECGTCKKCPDEWEDVAEQVDEILSYLHSQGVVIKVNRELPETLTIEVLDDTGFLGFRNSKRKFLRVKLAETGCVAVEPIINEE